MSGHPADLARAHIAGHPGCTTSQLYAAVGDGADYGAWLTQLHRDSRSVGVGQAADGCWYTAADCRSVAEALEIGVASPGTAMWLTTRAAT